VDARQQFARVERFAQVIVGPHLQTHDAVHVLALGGEHDDGRLVVRGAQAAANAQPVFAREHQVQHDEVDRVAGQQAAHRASVLGHPDVKPFLGQVAVEQVADAGVVVDHQDAVGAVRGVRHGAALLRLCVADCDTAFHAPPCPGGIATRLVTDVARDPGFAGTLAAVPLMTGVCLP